MDQAIRVTLAQPNELVSKPVSQSTTDTQPEVIEYHSNFSVEKGKSSTVPMSSY